MTPPPDLAPLESKRVWGTWDWHDRRTKAAKIFVPVLGEGPSTRRMAEWSLSFQLGTDAAVEYRSLLEVQNVEIFLR